MNTTDLYISNGTCFFGRGQVSDPNFIPCGNAALSGPQSYCYVGDYCLSATACWDNNRCTDPTFTSAKYIWSGCSKHPEWISIEKEPDCACNASRPLIRNPNGESSLDEIGSLPPTPGSTISFNPTAIPTVSSQSSRNSTATISGTITLPSISLTITPSPTTLSYSSATSSRGLSTGDKVGVGVGVGLGVPLLGVLAFLAYSLRCKKENSRKAEIQQEPTTQGALDSPDNQEKSSGPSQDKGAEEPSAQWSGYKPELHAETAHKSELAADEPKSLETPGLGLENRETGQIPELLGSGTGRDDKSTM
ncbi:hypothetical protein F5X99DRAFT_422628 [Biscogniauxia marginata]|nr:hypothetical protein F5X99DRAFT_422628 [Biscogniauxia marginata]